MARNTLYIKTYLVLSVTLVINGQDYYQTPRIGSKGPLASCYNSEGQAQVSKLHLNTARLEKLSFQTTWKSLSFIFESCDKYAIL